MLRITKTGPEKHGSEHAAHAAACYESQRTGHWWQQAARHRRPPAAVAVSCSSCELFACKDKSPEPLHARTSPFTCKDKRPGPHGAPAITGRAPRARHRTTTCAAPTRPGGRGPLVAPGARRLWWESVPRPGGPWTAPRWAATKLRRTSKRRA